MVTLALQVAMSHHATLPAASTTACAQVSFNSLWTQRSSIRRCAVQQTLTGRKSVFLPSTSLPMRKHHQTTFYTFPKHAICADSLQLMHRPKRIHYNQDTSCVQQRWTHQAASGVRMACSSRACPRCHRAHSQCRCCCHHQGYCQV